MGIYKIILILITGIAAGFMNSLAGGGSLLSMPMLITLGYPSAVANGTNRIAMLIQDITAISNFKNKGYSSFKFSIMLGIPAVIGAVIGSNIAVNISDKLFNVILAIVMILMLSIIIWEPQKRFFNNRQYLDETKTCNNYLACFIFFLIGLYGGFIQAGVGLLIISALAILTNMNLIKINSIKVFIVGLYMIPSIFIFLINGKIEFITGLILAVGTGIGAFIGSSLAIKRGEKFIKIVIYIAVLLMAGRLIGLY